MKPPVGLCSSRRERPHSQRAPAWGGPDFSSTLNGFAQTLEDKEPGDRFRDLVTFPIRPQALGSP